MSLVIGVLCRFKFSSFCQIILESKQMEFYYHDLRDVTGDFYARNKILCLNEVHTCFDGPLQEFVVVKEFAAVFILMSSWIVD